VLNAPCSEFCRAEKIKTISEGSFAVEAVESFFVTFFTDKESKGGNPCGFQERKLLSHLM
jgi:hypothetical protein